MASILKSMRLAADPNRLRLLLVLEQEELSVAELQEILSKGQSEISAEDFAIALADEAENPRHLRQRFTAGW